MPGEDIHEAGGWRLDKPSANGPQMSLANHKIGANVGMHEDWDDDFALR
jgi:hypothetical protein